MPENVVLGCDMGKNTFTISAVAYNRTVKILDSFSFPNTILGLTEDKLKVCYSKFVSSFIKIIKKYKPSYIYAERFMVRGRMHGASCELISYMMGIMHRICVKYKIVFIPITAAQWKNSLNRVLPYPPKVKKTKGDTPLKAWYRYIKPTQPHFLDSSMIGIYGVCKIKDKNLFLKVNKKMIDGICRLERKNHAANKKTRN